MRTSTLTEYRICVYDFVYELYDFRLGNKKVEEYNSDYGSYSK